jgi:manganese transport protein
MPTLSKEIREHASLADVHSTIDPMAKRSKWGKILAFFGPAYLVSVGYMDPGNWATDIAGGSGYGYSLLWVLLMSNIMAFILQSMSARLGLVSGRDLAQASREVYPPFVNFFLYGLAEIAIAACDLAEVLGMAIGLQLLFGLPLIYGVALTILDTFLLFFLQRLGMRKMEMFIISLIAIIGMSFFAELILAKPSGHSILLGFVPKIADSKALYITIGIIGATVMPHNLYLHSALVQTRKIDREHKSVQRALKFSIIDSAIALNIAFLVNASILILAASVFYTHSMFGIADIRDAHKLLAPLLGSRIAPVLFAVALIASGQSSTITGTLAGQIVMEGYLRLRIPMWIRRLVTRMLAVLPAFLVILISGEEKAGDLLVLSQVVLSIQLGFAVIPLIHFVSNPARMGKFAIRPSSQVVAWLIAVVILVFNGKLIYDAIGDLSSSLRPEQEWIKYLVLLLTAGVCCMLLYITFEPVVRRVKEYNVRIPHGPARAIGDLSQPVYHKIAITVDFSDMDYKAIRHAVSQGGKLAEYVFIHIVETAGAMLTEHEVGDVEAHKDVEYLREYVNMLQAQGYRAMYKTGYGRRSHAIARIVEKLGADLVVMGAHGHKGLKDIFFGETINAVRHKIKVPLLMVK